MEPGSVRVAEVAAETESESLPEIPLQLLPLPGQVALQLRTTLRQIAVGAGIARNQELMERVRALPNFPGISSSPAGGTFVMGGPSWLGICAIGVLPAPGVLPIDWMMASLKSWFGVALERLGVANISVGKIDGAWCPGFSDIAVDGCKLVGLGFRVTKDWIVVRGMMPVQPIDDADWELLVGCHRLIDVDINRRSNTSLVEASGHPQLTVGEVIGSLAEVAT